MRDGWMAYGRECAWIGVAVAALALAACSFDSEGPSGGTLFTSIPATESGVTFVNALPEDAMMNGFGYEYYYNGGGVAAGDLNGDGLPDLYFTANLNPNRLYMNRGGRRFEDVTDRAGVGGRRGWASGVTFADVNGDGMLDIYVSYSGAFEDPEQRRNVLYINKGVQDGVPRFIDEAAAYGLDDPAHTTQAAFFDYDLDGDLDVYLLNHGIPGYRSLEQLASGRSVYEVDRLYRNDGGRFVDVTAEAGLIDTNAGFGLGVSVSDIDGDGRPDIYVANDYSGRDYLYMGRQGGRFEEVLERAMPHIPYASMGSDIADFDGDGLFDIAVLEMAMPGHVARTSSLNGTEGERFAQLVNAGQHYQYAANALQWNRGVDEAGVPVFSDIAYQAGVAETDWSWAPLFADFDDDGRPDLFVTTGIAGQSIDPDFDDYVTRRIAEVEAVEGRVTHSLVEELLAKLPRRKVANHAFRNEGVLEFSDRTGEWGLDQASYSNGAAYADLDADGDLDLVVNNLMGEAFVYRNNGRERGGTHSLRVRFRGPARNAFGLGARVRVRSGGAWQRQELHLTRGYQSSVEPVLHFGLGASERVDTVEVVWPGGAREVRAGVAADTTIVFEYGDARTAGVGESKGPGGAPEVEPPARLEGIARASARTLFFEIAAGGSSAAARTRAAVDSAWLASVRPYPGERSGAAAAVGDLDGDGLDDFAVGAGRGVTVHYQGADGRYDAVVVAAAEIGAGERVATAAVFDADGDGRADVWLAIERVGASGARFRHVLMRSHGRGDLRAVRSAVAAAPAGAGAVLAAGDVDGDGDADLFIGARAVPALDAPAGSVLLRNDGGVFYDATAEAAPALANLGTVTDAVWLDANGDGRDDLLVVGEWTAPSLLLNESGSLRAAADGGALDAMTGWWQSVAAADFDADGDVDVVAGNFGLNHGVRGDAGAPLELYVADFDGDGADEAVLGYVENGRTYPWVGRHHLARELPIVLARFTSNSAYAAATLGDIVGAEMLGAARRLDARTFASTYFENRGDGRFDARPLPAAAQAAPVMGVAAADYDGDGALDIMSGGNLYDLHPTMPRADAGVGALLRGDGAGGFAAVAASESGVMLRGEVRRVVAVGRGTGAPPDLLVVDTGGGWRVLRVAERR